MNEISNFIGKCRQDLFYPAYRGQADKTWALTPSIGRLFDRINQKVVYGSWNDFESSLLLPFKRLSSPYLTKIPKSRVEWLVEAQHHGLATPLLDWSTSPLKALYFAIEDPAFDHLDAAVYIIEPNSISLEAREIEEFTYLDFYYPKHTNNRIIAQDACFTAFPYPEKIVPLDDLKNKNSFSSKVLKSITTITINAGEKPILREQLSILGINKMSIYPNLDGVCNHIMNGLA